MNKWQKIGLAVGVSIVAIAIGYESIPFVKMQVDNLKQKLKGKKNEDKHV